MRFAPESNHGANAGLINARNRLEPVYQKYKHLGLTYSDLWTLAGVRISSFSKSRELD